MAAKKKSKAAKPVKRNLKDTVFQWKFVSNSEAHGMRAVYSTVLYPDGVLTCNCPGWIFSKGVPGTKTCKHTGKVAVEAKDVLQKIKKGEPLPKMLDDGIGGDLAHLKTSDKAPTPTSGYGRTIQLD